MRGINPFAATGREWLRPLPYPVVKIFDSGQAGLGYALANVMPMMTHIGYPNPIKPKNSPIILSKIVLLEIFRLKSHTGFGDKRLNADDKAPDLVVRIRL
uniref:Uncharacterized protein n=1 Tax=Candidatus Kentrum sp. LFY TaxID=2126342 RepID=A0A450UWM8_9GAMM|nr:MAG: hypothetical protein BECKLFY1418B_GA0070995_109110 [Candidatus Kentron sp. LFY]